MPRKSMSCLRGVAKIPAKNDIKRSNFYNQKRLAIIKWDYPAEENKVLANTFIKDEYMK